MNVTSIADAASDDAERDRGRDLPPQILAGNRSIHVGKKRETADEAGTAGDQEF